MFETAELHRSVAKDEYERRLPALRTALLAAQQRLDEADFPVVVVIAGVEGAGKGETINLLHQWMDPRFLQTHAFDAPTDEERGHPPAWRWWRTLPRAGRLGIFFGSWYTAPIVDRAEGRSKADDLDRALARIVSFERTLVEDGALLVKLWFHVSKKVQKKRFHELAASKATAWRVTDEDWAKHAKYDRYRKVAERALRETSVGEAPWTVVEGEDERWRSLAVGEHLLQVLTARLDVKQAKAATPRAVVRAQPARARAAAAKAGRTTVLSGVDLDATIDDDEADRRIAKAQGRIALRWREARALGASLVLLFEGWDAAGKGGAIRRITPAIDARCYHVVPVAAPTDEEKAHHYLWRFWRHIPRQGRVTIFDRSWYGRVLVERVEGFCREDEWMRAYAELNEFEEQLHEHGAEIVKLWLHIDRKEQLRRFKAREETPFKRFKIGPEDYRNRGKWQHYEAAVDDMVTRTSTEFAPWTLVAANDKKKARVEILELVADRLGHAIKRARKRAAEKR
jgi:AMP-polyphosphate phosphotransferase